MPQMKDVKINGVEGRGYLEVIPPSPPRTRRRSQGLAIFEGQEKIDAVDEAFGEGRAEYEGVVYRGGQAKTESASIFIKNVKYDLMSGEATVVFKLG